MQKRGANLANRPNSNPSPSNLRLKLLAFEDDLFSFRTLLVLDTIERDGYVLRAVYNERGKLSTWLKMAWLAVSLTLRHFVRRGLRDS